VFIDVVVLVKQGVPTGAGGAPAVFVNGDDTICSLRVSEEPANALEVSQGSSLDVALVHTYSSVGRV
jgi:hypothetical protein